MKHFQEVLITLGASKTELLSDAPDWDFWMAEYRTPVSEIRGHYLYLKHKCPLKEASVKNLTSWKTQSGNDGYEVIVTPRSQLAKNTQHTLKVFAGRRIRTSKQLLWDNFLEGIKWKPVSTEEYFIDPSLKLCLRVRDQTRAPSLPPDHLPHRHAHHLFCQCLGD